MEHIRLNLLLDFFKTNMSQESEVIYKRLIFNKLDSEAIKNIIDPETKHNLRYFLNKCLGDTQFDKTFIHYMMNKINGNKKYNNMKNIN